MKKIIWTLLTSGLLCLSNTSFSEDFLGSMSIGSEALVRCVAVKRNFIGRPLGRFFGYGPNRRIACFRALRRCEASRPFTGTCSVRPGF